MNRRVFITAAEVSGDTHAAQLIRELRASEPGIQIEGIGGPAMAAAGALIHTNTVANAAMGWRGILRASEIYKILHATRRQFAETKPDLWIGVDSPSMNFHFAAVARQFGVPTLQFVAPQLWAWAIWRMKKLRRLVDQVACILPFEESFFRSRGVNATYVGHPLFDELPPRHPRPAEERFPHAAPIIGLMAGSRKSEATANFSGMLQAAERIAQQFPQATFLAPTTAATHPIVQEMLGTTVAQGVVTCRGLKVEFGQNQFDQMAARCDLCLTVSGTATLHIAAFSTPMVVIYHINPIAWGLVGRFLVPTRTFALVNVLATQMGGKHIVPELVPWRSPQRLADIAIDLLQHPEKLHAQRNDLATLIQPLDRPGASAKTAQLALDLMNRRRPA